VPAHPVPILYANPLVGKADSGTMTDHVPVSGALKLVTPFKGDKWEVLAFTANVDMTFAVIDPSKADTLYKFVLTRISGELQIVITHQNLENWEELKAFLRNTYMEKRPLDYHATQLFSARQGKSESMSDWIQTTQRLGSEFGDVALQNCEPDEKVGILTLADKLRNICFMQGLSSDSIQTIVRSRNHDNFDDIVETALEEESAIQSKFERYKGLPTQLSKCSNYGKVGHTANKCYLKEKKDVRVNHFSNKRRSSPNQYKQLVCYNCGPKGHIVKECSKPKCFRERKLANQKRD